MAHFWILGMFFLMMMFVCLFFFQYNNLSNCFPFCFLSLLEVFVLLFFANKTFCSLMFRGAALFITRASVLVRMALVVAFVLWLLFFCE